MQYRFHKLENRMTVEVPATVDEKWTELKEKIVKATEDTVKLRPKYSQFKPQTMQDQAFINGSHSLGYLQHLSISLKLYNLVLIRFLSMICLVTQPSCDR